MSDPAGTIRNGHRTNSVGTTPAVLSVTRSGGRGIRTHGDVAATMVFKTIRGSRFATGSSLTFLDKLIFAVFALVSIDVWGWVLYYPCQRLGA